LDERRCRSAPCWNRSASFLAGPRSIRANTIREVRRRRFTAFGTQDQFTHTAATSECRYRWLRVPDLNLRRFGPHDRKSRHAQLSIRHGDRYYDGSIAGLGTGKA
jgi:hypothetical protein